VGGVGLAARAVTAKDVGPAELGTDVDLDTDDDCTHDSDLVEVAFDVHVVVSP
jgi:hypothetical protein